jgi:FAD/FMN-containing dehydrogenase
VGLDKRDVYERHADPVKQQLSRAIKALLDPSDMLNPGKIVGPGPETR